MQNELEKVTNLEKRGSARDKQVKKLHISYQTLREEVKGVSEGEEKRRKGSERNGIEGVRRVE